MDQNVVQPLMLKVKTCLRTALDQFSRGFWYFEHLHLAYSAAQMQSLTQVDGFSHTFCSTSILSTFYSQGLSMPLITEKMSTPNYHYILVVWCSIVYIFNACKLIKPSWRADVATLSCTLPVTSICVYMYLLAVVDQIRLLVWKIILPCPPYKNICNVKQLFAPCNHFMERPPSRGAVIKHVVNI